jgi:hypothetical protein
MDRLRRFAATGRATIILPLCSFGNYAFHTIAFEGRTGCARSSANSFNA